MAHDPPSLVLSDIVHGMSPSPVPQSFSKLPSPRSSSPDIVEEDEVVSMRKRVLELNTISGAGTNISSTEKELVDMVRSQFVFLAKYSG